MPLTLETITLAIMLALPMATTAEARELAHTVKKTGDPLVLDAHHKLVKKGDTLEIVSTW